MGRARAKFASTASGGEREMARVMMEVPIRFNIGKSSSGLRCIPSCKASVSSPCFSLLANCVREPRDDLEPSVIFG